MAKNFYKVCKQELLDIHEQMEPFPQNKFNNSFSVWRRHSCQFHAFSAFLAAKKVNNGVLTFDHNKLREKLLPTGDECIFIAHAKSDAKMAYLFKAIMEQKYRRTCVLSGDLWEGRDEVIEALWNNLKLKDANDQNFATVYADHLQLLTEECLTMCRDFVFVLPAKATLDTPKLVERAVRTSPWLPGHMAMAYTQAMGTSPETIVPIDLSFLQGYELRPLIACIRGLQTNDGRGK